MDKMIVVVFDSEAQAYRGSRALDELHQEGSIGMYAAALIAKDEGGDFAVRQSADEGPIGTAVGMFTGSMLGLLGGIPGVAIGALLGGLVGALADLNSVGVEVDFVEEVGRRLTPGKAALVAEVAETWVTPIDARMTELGGIVLRRSRTAVIDDQLDNEIAAEEAELARLRQEFEDTRDQAKDNIRAQIDKVTERLESLSERASQRAATLKEEAEAKIAALQSQAKTASADLREQYQKRAAEIQESCSERVAKLNEACRVTKEAVSD